MLIELAEFEVGADSRPVTGPYCIYQDSLWCGTWQQLVAEIVHQPGPKHGMCFVPSKFKYSGHKPLRRTKENVRGASAVVCIDSDGLSQAQAEAFWAAVQRRGLKAVAYSSHSNGKEGKPGCRFRALFLADREQTEDEIQKARLGLGEMFGKLLGVSPDAVVDKRATSSAHLFHWPRYDESRKQHVFVWHSDGPNTVVIDELVANAPQAIETTHIPLDELVRGDSRQVDAAQEAVSDIAGRIRMCDSSLRRYTAQATFKLGRYIAAGLLNEKAVLDELGAALVAQRANYGDNLCTLGERKAQLVEGLRDGIRRGPAWPLDGHKDDEGRIVLKAPRVMTNIERLKETLLEQTPSKLYSAAEARDEIIRVLSEPIPMQPEVHLVHVSTGAGKTWSARQVATQRAQRGQVTVIATEQHKLLRQIRMDLEQVGTKPFVYHSSFQPTEVTGGPSCLRLNEPPVLAVLKAGGNGQASLCRSCPFRSSCEAQKARSPSLEQMVRLVPYAMIQRAVDDAQAEFSDVLVICDEDPPGDEQAIISVEDLELLRDSAVFPMLKDYQATMVKLLISDRLDGLEVSDDTLTELLKHRGQPHLGFVTKNSAAKFERELGLIRILLRSVPNWRDSWQSEGNWYTDVAHSAWAVLQEHGGVVLSATPDTERYDRLGVPVHLHRLAVRDHLLTPRVIIYSSESNRRSVCPGGVINWDVVKRALAKCLQDVPVTSRVFLATYKNVADALNTTHAELLKPYNVSVIYYEATKGRDDWRECDDFITMFDARTPPKVREDGSHDWSASSRSARRQAAQAHGRARDAQPRVRAARHIHYGSEPPQDFNAENCIVVTERQLSDGYAEALKELFLRIGMVNAAKRLDVSTATLKRWLTGATCPNTKNMEKIRQLVVTEPVPGTQLAPIQVTPEVPNAQSTLVDRPDCRRDVVAVDVREERVLHRDSHRPDSVRDSDRAAGTRRLGLTPGAASGEASLRCSKTSERSTQATYRPSPMQLTGRLLN
jgi:hypothetical protein